MSLKVGLALYSVRGAMKEDPIKTIKRVGELGYKYVEAANYNLYGDTFLGFGVKPKEFKKIMDDFGMKLINVHFGEWEFWKDKVTGELKTDIPHMKDISEDLFKSLVLDHLEAGNDLVTVPINFYPSDKDGVMKRCEYLNRLSKAAKAEGGRVGYHFHFQEYDTVDDKMIIQYIYENTDLLFEIDTFWAMRAEKDPIEILKQYGDRVVMTHQKDFSRDTNIPISFWDQLGKVHASWYYIGKRYTNVTMREFVHCDIPEIFAEIGTGIMNIQEIINAVNAHTKAEYILLEQDFSKYNDEFKSVEISMNEFKKFSGIDWAK